MILPIAYYDAPILRQRAQEVEAVNEQVRQLAHEMMLAMDYYHGTGLAAPQVHRSLRLFVARLSQMEDHEQWLAEPIEVFINPILSEPSSQLCSESEGCLSIPGLRAQVQRPTSIRIRAINLEGESIDRVYTGYLARILMHECDHLDGMLYIDRLPRSVRKQLEPELKQIRQRYGG